MLDAMACLAVSVGAQLLILCVLEARRADRPWEMYTPQFEQVVAVWEGRIYVPDFLRSGMATIIYVVDGGGHNQCKTLL